MMVNLALKQIQAAADVSSTSKISLASPRKLSR